LEAKTCVERNSKQHAEKGGGGKKNRKSYLSVNATKQIGVSHGTQVPVKNLPSCSRNTCNTVSERKVRDEQKGDDRFQSEGSHRLSGRKKRVEFRPQKKKKKRVNLGVPSVHGAMQSAGRPNKTKERKKRHTVKTGRINKNSPPVLKDG